MKRWFLFLVAVLALSASQARSQPVLKFSAYDSAQTIIVKLRSAAALSDATLASKLYAVATSSDGIKPVFKRHDGSDLTRILQIPLRAGVSASDAVKSLAGLKGIEYAEPNFRYKLEGTFLPNDSLFSGQWWLKNIHAPEAWDITEGDSNIVIGFVDTGVDWFHTDLRFQFRVNPKEDLNGNGLFDAWPVDSIGRDARGNLVHGDIDGKDHDGNGYANDVIGYNFVDQEIVNIGHWFGRDPFPYDERGGYGSGHGTAVAGILAAQQNNGSGISGVAPKCRLLAMRAFTADGQGEDDDVASAIVYAADNGVRILNLSFGAQGAPSLLMRDAIRYASSKGVLIFASSGNEGGDALHFPSDFDEVVSVGGTTNDPTPDHIYGTEIHGEGLDIVAPAEAIITTAPNNQYFSDFRGTSGASPIAAGVAALLLSKNPSLSPVEVRSALESTAQDVATPGYDHYSANGRVDAFRALKYLGGARIKMTSPRMLDEFRLGDTIPVSGSAMSTLFSSWQIDYAYGSRPDTNPSVNNWHRIASGASQMVDTLLAKWGTAVLTQQGEYTLRLVVSSSDHRTTEEHTIVRMFRDAPQFISSEINPIYVTGERGLLVLATSDIPCQLEVRYSTPDGATSSKLEDKIGVEHAVLIKREEAVAGVELAITEVLHAPNGDTTTINDAATIPDEAFPEQGFAQKPYALAAGWVLDTIMPLPGGDLVVTKNYDAGKLMAFAFNGNTFRSVDSADDYAFPIALGNSSNDNRPELLTQYPHGTTHVYKANASHPIFGDVVFTNSKVRGSAFAQLEAGASQDVVAIFDSSFQAYRKSGSNYDLVGSMVNPSPAAGYNPRNYYASLGQPSSAHADLNHQGFENLITLDDDADLVVYQRDANAPTGFRATYVESNDGIGDGALVTTGDFDGDGLPDIAYAFRAIDQFSDSLGEAPGQFWTVRVLRNKGGMKFERIMDDRFFDRIGFSGGDGSSSIDGVRNVTGRTYDDLVLTFFPNLYVLEFDSSSRAMRPVWRHPFASSAKGTVCWDFDHNGKRELGFLSGDSIRFFEPISTIADRVPSPAGLHVSPRDTDRVDLEWSPVEHATSYIILRADVGANAYSVIDNSEASRYIDSNVVNGARYIYSVAAIATGYTVDTSLPAFGVDAFVHAKPRLTSAVASKATIAVQTSQPVRDNRPAAGWVMVDDSIAPASLIVSDSEIVLGLIQPLDAGTHTVRVRSFGLRDVYNSPFDTAHGVTFEVRADTIVERFYIVRWTFDQTEKGLRIHVVFNEQPGQNALDVTHYSLSPYGTLLKVERDPDNPNALFIDVASGVQLVGLGVPFVLCVHGISSERDVALDETTGDCAGVSRTEPDLEHAFVYPNPAKKSDGQVTFAGLTAQADVRIYTSGMKFIRHIVTSEQQGGATWDMRDELGKMVESGLYLYFVTGKNASGSSAEGKASKLVIVEDK